MVAGGGKRPGVTAAEQLPVAAIVALGVTQIVGYGTLYYSFSILASDMAKDLDWSMEWIFGVLSAALLVGGVTAPWLGNWIDRVGAGRIMTIGSVLAAASLVACAYAPNRTAFIAGLIAIEVASNLVQYGAAFALLVQIRPHAAQRSITVLTLIAGFASTVFWPITSALHAAMSWQNVYLVFAALNLAICLPLHAWLSRMTASYREATGDAPAPVVGTLPEALRPAGLALMVTAFALQSLVSSAILVHMVPLLAGLGLGATAALVGTVFGPAQVIARFVNMMFGINLAPLRLAAIAAALMATGVFTLTLGAPSIPGAIGFALIFGMGNGLFSIVTGALQLTLFGSEGYGRLQGKVMAARLIVSALAPFALAYAMAQFGVPWSLAITAMLGGAAVPLFGVMALLVRRRA